MHPGSCILDNAPEIWPGNISPGQRTRGIHPGMYYTPQTMYPRHTPSTTHPRQCTPDIPQNHTPTTFTQGPRTMHPTPRTPGKHPGPYILDQITPLAHAAHTLHPTAPVPPGRRPPRLPARPGGRSCATPTLSEECTSRAFPALGPPRWC